MPVRVRRRGFVFPAESAGRPRPGLRWRATRTAPLVPPARADEIKGDRALRAILKALPVGACPMPELAPTTPTVRPPSRHLVVPSPAVTHRRPRPLATTATTLTSPAPANSSPTASGPVVHNYTYPPRTGRSPVAADRVDVSVRPSASTDNVPARQREAVRPSVSGQALLRGRPSSLDSGRAGHALITASR